MIGCKQKPSSFVPSKIESDGVQTESVPTLNTTRQQLSTWVDLYQKVVKAKVQLY